MSEQLPPLNLEAEESILGGILFDPNAISRIADILTSEAFYLVAHQLIYQAALELHRQDKPTDLMTVTSWLSDHKLLKKVGETAKLAQLVNRTVSAINIDRYAELVLDKYKRRQLIEVGNEIANLGYDTTTELETVLNQSEDRIFRVTERQTDEFKAEGISKCLVSVLHKLKQGENPALSTGLTDLDQQVGGLVKESLIVVAARPSMGKTWMGCHLANHVATTYREPVVFFSVEMSKEQITKRFLAMHSKIDSQRLIYN